MIKSKEDLRIYLEEDRSALRIKHKRPKIFGDEIWKFQIALRKHEYYSNKAAKSILDRISLSYWKYLHHSLGIKLGFSIPINVFDGGLRINHFGYLVVNGKTRIGKFCNIHQGVNIGQNATPEDVPTIGDYVYIGPGAKIFGRIHIADRIAIGANAVVNKSFEEKNITIAGIPAKKIKETGTTYVF